jgi:UMF1 family MFS transporter
MSFDEDISPRISTRYEGEDLSATSPRELKGWYSYTIAAEVFAVVGVGKQTSDCVPLLQTLTLG